MWRLLPQLPSLQQCTSFGAIVRDFVYNSIELWRNRSQLPELRMTSLFFKLGIWPYSSGAFCWSFLHSPAGPILLNRSYSSDMRNRYEHAFFGSLSSCSSFHSTGKSGQVNIEMTTFSSHVYLSFLWRLWNTIDRWYVWDHLWYQLDHQGNQWEYDCTHYSLADRLCLA